MSPDILYANTFWTNNGPTEATKFLGWVAYEFSKDTPNLSMPNTKIIKHGGDTVGPGERKQMLSYKVPIDHIRGALDQKGKIFLWGSIEFKDIFDVAHRTNFCLNIVPLVVAEKITFSLVDNTNEGCNYSD